MHKKEIERLTALMRSITALAKSESRELTAEEQAKLSVYQSEIAEHQKALDEEARRAAAHAEAQRLLAERTAKLEVFKSFGFEAEGEKILKDAEASKREFTLSDANSKVLELIKQHGTPSAVRVEMGESGEDKFRAAAVDALMIKGGYAPEKPADGAMKLSHMRLSDIAAETLERGREFSGSELRSMSSEELFHEVNKRSYNPTSAFTAIADAAVKKTLVDAYQKTPTTFQLWTSKGVLHDFKTESDRSYVYGSTARLEKVPENGELKHDKISTAALPTRKLETYGKQTSMSRQAFINDDVGLVLRIPAVYGAMAKQTINEQVYDILFNNGKIFDGKVLFDATNHKNLAAADGAPSQTSIQKLMLLMGRQTDHFGNRIVNKPKFLITGVGYHFTLTTLFGSRYTPDDDKNSINPLYDEVIGKNLIEEPYLNQLADATTGKKVPWFLITDPTFAKSIQVDYLDGNETPTIRRTDGAPGTLGFVWDIYHDWGVSVVDYRGVYRNNGAAVEE